MDNMQDIVDVQPIDLNSFMEERELKPLPFPTKALKNRAAQTALMTDEPERIEEQYQSMIAEAQSGQEYTRENILNKKLAEKQPKDIGAIMSILADQSVSMEQKQAAIQAINSDWAKDTSVILATEAYEQPSKGESIEAESVRISGAEQYREIHEYNKFRQTLRNKHEIGANAKTVVDFLAFLAPFSANKYGVSTLKPIADELNLKISKGEAAILPGSAMEKISKAVQNVPVNQRLELDRHISQIVSEHSGLVFNSDNDFVAMVQLQQVLDGDYTTFDKVVDNTVGILDTIGLGGAVKWAKGVARTKLFKRSAETEETKDFIRKVVETNSPVSPIETLKDANPEKARSAYALVVQSEADEVAEALTGTTRQDAIASQAIPQVGVEDGSVITKIIEPDRELVKAWEETAGVALTDAELRRVKAEIIHDLRNVTGLQLHDNLMSVKWDNGRFAVKALYGNTEGGFLKAEEALNQAKLSLREFGVRDDELQLYKRDAGEYIPITLEEAKLQDGDYLVALEGRFTGNPLDVTRMDDLDVRRNWLDRVPWLRSKKSGTLANTILDHSSMLHPKLVGSAVVLTDRGVMVDKKILKMFEEYAAQHNKFPQARQDKLYEYIKRANEEGLDLDVVSLKGEGFTDAEIDALKTWRNAWDTIYWFENADLGRTLHLQNYKLFVDNKGTELPAKPLAKSFQYEARIDKQTKKKVDRAVESFYDPVSDTVVRKTREEIDALYDGGGTVAELRRPMDVNGKKITHILVDNTSSGYLRTIRDTDQLLSYKKGYYQRSYTAPKFVTVREVTADGNEYFRAIGVAGDTEEANQIKARLVTANGLNPDDVKIREDIKTLRTDTDEYWDLQSMSGRIAQRRRGELLENAIKPITGFSEQYMLDPIESSIRAARSLSSRISMRDWLETSKQRAVAQYGEFFPLDKFGNPKWPNNANELLIPESATSKRIGEARTTVEYINYMQHGYENALDNAIKGLFNITAETFANMGLTKLEKGALAVSTAQTGVTDWMKTGVFMSFLANNPFRQVLIQAHQSIRLAGLNPSYFLNQINKDVAAYSKKLLKQPMSKEEQEFVEFVEKSGMIDAVDRHNLIRGPLLAMAESQNKVKRAVGKVLSLPRKFGFDLGEQTNMLIHLGALRDRAIKAGKDLSDTRVRDELYSEVRAITGDMNFAGDMPYNQNAMGLIMQFYQYPHKMITQVTTNRRVKGSTNPFNREFYQFKKNDKLRLALTDMLLWGVPGATVISNMVGEDMLPEDPKAREAVVFGLESMILNDTFSWLAGRDVDIDFSAFAPHNVDGFAHLFSSAIAGRFDEIVNKSPAFSLYFKEGSRMQEAIGRLLTYTGKWNTDEPMTVEEGLAVLNSMAEAGASGWANWNKAMAILETGKRVDAKGNLLMENAGYIEAGAQILGLGSQREVLEYGALRALSDNEKAFEDDVMKVYNSYIKVLAKDTKLSNQDPEWAKLVLGGMKQALGGDPKAMAIVQKQLQKDVYGKKFRIIKGALEDAGLVDAGSPATLKNLGIINDEDYKRMNIMVNDIKEMSKKIREAEE